MVTLYYNNHYNQPALGYAPCRRWVERLDQLHFLARCPKLRLRLCLTSLSVVFYVFSAFY